MSHQFQIQEGHLHTYYVDHLGPMPSTDKNYQHLLELLMASQKSLGEKCSIFLGPYEIVKVKFNERCDVMKIGRHEGPMRIWTCGGFIKPLIENQSASEADSGSHD